MQNVFNEKEIIKGLNSFVIPSTDMDNAIDEYLEEHKDITAPHELDWDLRLEHISDIRKYIEQRISKKWDAFEHSRTVNINNISKNVSLVEVKKAIMPYVKRGWFITISMPCPKDKNKMDTYEADILFITTNSYGKKDQTNDIFLRMYPNTPIRKKYITNIVRSNYLFGVPITLASIVVSIILIKMISIWFIGAVVVMLIVSLLFMAMMSGEICSIRKKIKPSKKYGPLLWKDDIEGYKTPHKRVSRTDRMREVVENRVLLLPE